MWQLQLKIMPFRQSNHDRDEGRSGVPLPNLKSTVPEECLGNKSFPGIIYARLSLRIICYSIFKDRHPVPARLLVNQHPELDLCENVETFPYWKNTPSTQSAESR